MKHFALSLQLALGTANALSPSFDYVIVGAGTSGLVVANRLSEDPSVRVAVVEPGEDERDNPLVWDANRLMQSLNTSLNWNYETLPQPGLLGKRLEFPQGKTSVFFAEHSHILKDPLGRAWGGTSVINGMSVHSPPPN